MKAFKITVFRSINQSCDTITSSLLHSYLFFFPSGLVLNSAVLSSTARPAVAEELVPPVKVILSVLNVSFVNSRGTRDLPYKKVSGSFPERMHIATRFQKTFFSIVK